MITFAQISDTHFGTEVTDVVAALERCLKELNPDLILLSGDITQRARKSQFRAAKNFLEATGKPYFTIPGNHDLPLFDLITRFTRPYRFYKDFFGKREFIHVQNNVALVGLDATHPWHHKMGSLNLSHVSRILTDARKKLASKGLLLVSVHQPLLTAWKEDRSEEIIGERAIADLFSEHGVDAVISGHVHVPLICLSDKLYPDLQHPFVHIGAGTAVSHRTREGTPNSFNVIKADAAAATIEVFQYDYSATIDHFELFQHQIFTR